MKLENTPYLNTEGVPSEVVAHLSLLVEDYRQNCKANKAGE